MFCDRQVDGEERHEAQLEAEVVKNIPNVRAEKGCIRYDFHKNRSEDGTFLSMRSGKARKPSTPTAKHRTCWPAERTKDLLACPTVVTVWSGLIADRKSAARCRESNKSRLNQQAVFIMGSGFHSFGFPRFRGRTPRAILESTRPVIYPYKNL